MKEAFGGIFNIIYVVIFLVVVISILGLVVSYTKAFKMKNAIISVIEEYEGSGCFPEQSGGTKNTICRNKIKEKAQELAYSPVSLNCDTGNGFYNADNFYCYSVDKRIKDGNCYVMAKVVTQVNISFPLIDKIMGFSFFQVSGDTKWVQRPSISVCY